MIKGDWKISRKVYSDIKEKIGTCVYSFFGANGLSMNSHYVCGTVLNLEVNDKLYLCGGAIIGRTQDVDDVVEKLGLENFVWRDGE